MIKGVHRFRGLCLSALVGAVASMVVVTTQAAQFGIRVVNGSGEPVPGASVCIGLEGNYAQFAATFTDLDGRVPMIDVPNVPLVVTVSRTRFDGVRFMQPALGYNLLRDVTLLQGQPGPRCRADSSLVGLPNPPAIHVRDVWVDRDSSGTVLRASFVGDADGYRISTDPDFFGDWSPLSEVEQTGRGIEFAGRSETPHRSTIPVPTLGDGTSAIYLQLRKTQGSESSWLEARSDVIEISLPPL